MRSHLMDEMQTVAVKRGDEFSCRKRVKATVIDTDVQTVTAMRGASSETSATSTESGGPSGNDFPSSINS
jgi:hypothetical protein